MADIVLINPRFEVSYWGMEHALPFMGKRANLPVACLPLLAALTPEGHTVTLMDENVEAINYERCAQADIVGVTGMSVQRFRMKEILAELTRRLENTEEEETPIIAEHLRHIAVLRQEGIVAR